MRGVLLALAFVACDARPSGQQAAPTGQVGAIIQSATALLNPNADIADQRLEEVLEGADLRNALGAQADAVIANVRKTRAAALAAWKSGSAVSGQHLASVSEVTSEFSVPLFARTLADSLDMATKSGAPPPRTGPTTSNAESGGVFTTTTINIGESFTVSGSRVTLRMDWNYVTANIDTATGQTIYTLSDDRSMTGGIDVCPNDAGIPGHRSTSSRR
jgi:hypothetical protein